MGFNIGKALKAVANPVGAVIKATVKPDSKAAAQMNKIEKAANPAKVAKVLANPATAFVKAVAPKGKAAAAATKMEKQLTRYNPLNVAVDTSKAITAGSLNFTSRLLTGKNAKTFSTNDGIGGKSFFAKGGEKVVQQGDKWMATKGKGVMAVGSVALAVVGTVIPPVGIIAGVAGAGFGVRNKVVDAQAAKRASDSTSITGTPDYQNTGIGGGTANIPQGLPPAAVSNSVYNQSGSGVSAAQGTTEYVRPSLAALLALPISGYLKLTNQLA